MPYRRMIVVSVAVLSAMALFALAALHRLPPGAQLPSHWNISGEPDRFLPARDALVMPIWLAGFISLLMGALPFIEPLQNRLERSAGLYRTGWATALALMAFMEFAVGSSAFGLFVPTTMTLAAVGLVLIVIGNALPKSRPGFFVGIRTPWTINDEDNWIATHRVGAWTTIAAGLMMILAAVLPIDVEMRTALIFATVALTMVPIGYSWWYWRAHRTG